jgi:queuine tRNA-ribosyltransferase catalytic subunit
VTLETATAHGLSIWRLCIVIILTIDAAITQHNIVFQARVMGGARDAIIEARFPAYLRTFFANYFGNEGYPEWCVNALRSVGVDLLEGNSNAKVLKGDGAKWEYSDVS